MKTILPASQRCLVAVLLLGSSVAFGADKCVDPVLGDDVRFDGSQMEIDGRKGPYKTLNHAWQEVSDGATIYLAGGLYDKTSQGEGWYLHIDHGKTVTFRPAEEGGIAVLSGASWAGVIRFDAESPADQVTFKDVTFSPVDTHAGVWPDGKNISAVFDHCTFWVDGPGKTALWANTDKSGARRIALVNCCNLQCSTQYCIRLGEGQGIVMDNCLVAHSSNMDAAQVLYVAGKLEEVTVTNNIFLCSGSCLRFPTSAQIEHIRVSGNHISLGSREPIVYGVSVGANAGVRRVAIEDNTLRIQADPNTIVRGIWVGASSAGLPVTLRAPLVGDNTLIFAGDDYRGIGVFLGDDVADEVVINNHIAGFQHGIWDHSRGGYCSGNTVHCTNGFVLMGGGSNVLVGNSVVSVDAGAEGRCIVFGRKVYTSVSSDSNTFMANVFADHRHWDLSRARPGMVAIVKLTAATLVPSYYGIVMAVDDANNSITVDRWRSVWQETPHSPADNHYYVEIMEWSSSNTVLNNVFDGSRSKYTMTFDYNPRSGEDYIDYNCYRPGTGALSNIPRPSGGYGVDSLADLQEVWSSGWTRVHAGNDSHSIETDPLFVDASAGDLRLRADSPCLLAGKGPAGSSVNIGAWQGPGLDVGLPADCASAPAMDFNGDCVVDLTDLAIFSQDWLQCGLDGCGRP